MTQTMQTSGDKILHIPLPNQQATEKLAQNLSSLLKGGDIVALWGDLGVGKSTLCRAVIQSLCGADTTVPSPTFTLIQSYLTPDFDIWHMDMYRLNEPDEAYELGIEEAFVSACCLIEWPDKLGSLLPDNRIDIMIEYDSDTDKGDNKGDSYRTIALYAPPSQADRFKPLLG